MAAVAGALVLWGGCARIDDPEPDGKNTIGFNPGTLLLQDDAPTKAGTLKGGDFEIGDKIAVFGRRYGNSQTSDVFNNTVVEKTSATEWTYAPLKAWYWLPKEITTTSWAFIPVTRVPPVWIFPETLPSKRITASTQAITT